MGKASSSRDNDLDEDVSDFETRLVRKVDARRGIGSSGLEDCDNSGRNGLYGSCCSSRVEAREGESAKRQHRKTLVIDLSRQMKYR